VSTAIFIAVRAIFGADAAPLDSRNVTFLTVNPNWFAAHGICVADRARASVGTGFCLADTANSLADSGISTVEHAIGVVGSALLTAGTAFVAADRARCSVDSANRAAGKFNVWRRECDLCGR
jgi:hypothetical protein